MPPLNYIFATLWSWFLETGLDLLLILLIGMLVPRIGRLVMRVVRHRVESDVDEESGKNKLAFAGVGLYIVQIIAFLILIVASLQQIGFSLAGVAIPATVASAAIGFGAQSIVADFLAGFFILTEKQFGVGDWVRFEGSGVVVEGTVVEVTMRATTIRTISQQTVIIPNSAAKVCINNSKEWSRAVVAMPVPMLGSKNINEVIARSESATRRALNQDEVRAVVIGELDVHPAVDVQPPTVVGMPWLVTMRFMVQVTAGNQWLVERAVRTRIIDEFWNEYGSATTTSGTFVDTLALDDRPLDHPTEVFQIPGATGQIDQPTKAYNRKPVLDVPVDSLEDTQTINMGAGGAITPAAKAPETLIHEAPAAETASVTDDGEVEPTPEGTHPNRPDVSMSVPPEDTPENEEKTHLPGVFRTDSYAKSWQKVLSLGGRVRMSTSLLLFGLFALLVLKLFTIEPSENWDNSRGGSSTSDNETAVSTSNTPSVESPLIEDSLPTESTTPITTESTQPTESAGTTGSTAPLTPGEVSEQPTTGTQSTMEDSPATAPSQPTQAPTSAPTTQPQSTPTGVQAPAAPLQEPAVLGEGA